LALGVLGARLAQMVLVAGVHILELVVRIFFPQVAVDAVRLV
jgi:hypothetical protein